MNKEKQIEEMYKDVYDAINHNAVIDITHGGYLGVNTEGLTRELYDDGYRKASEVAREILEEIAENLNNLIRYYKEKRKYVTEVEYSEFEQRYCDIKIRTFEERLIRIVELKKKYIEEENHIWK